MPESMIVSAIQTIPVLGDLGQSVQDHVRLATRAAKEGARIVVFPELSLTGYSRQLTQSEAISSIDKCVMPLRNLASSFLTPTGYDHDTDLLRTYARPHQMGVLMANQGAASGEWSSAGKSALWSATGELLAPAASEGEAVVVAEVSTFDHR